MLPEDDRVIETCRERFKCFNVNFSLLFIVRRAKHWGAKWSYAIINKATCFNPLDSSSGLYNMVSYRVPLLLLPTGSRGLQYASYKVCYIKILINLLTPNVNYSGRTAPLTPKVAFYIFIQQI